MVPAIMRLIGTRHPRNFGRRRVVRPPARWRNRRVSVAAYARSAQPKGLAMNPVRFTRFVPLLAGVALVCGSQAANAQSLSPREQLTRDIYQELIEINTVTATGDTL